MKVQVSDATRRAGSFMEEIWFEELETKFLEEILRESTKLPPKLPIT